MGLERESRELSRSSSPLLVNAVEAGLRHLYDNKTRPISRHARPIIRRVVDYDPRVSRFHTCSFSFSLFLSLYHFLSFFRDGILLANYFEPSRACIIDRVSAGFHYFPVDLLSRIRTPVMRKTRADG